MCVVGFSFPSSSNRILLFLYACLHKHCLSLSFLQLGLPKQAVPDRGQMSNGSTSRSSVSCSGMNAHGGSLSSSTRKSSISCSACTTENISDVAHSNASDGVVGGVHSTGSLNSSCSIKGSNGLRGGSWDTNTGAKGSSASGYCGNNRRETVTPAVEGSSPLPSSQERGRQEVEVELSGRGGVLLDNNCNTSSPTTSSVSSCLSSPLSQPPDSSSTNGKKRVGKWECVLECFTDFFS